jgi:20S proteasome alpha/beta subunit
VVAMVGKDCVAIASDLRLGVQSLGIASNFQKVSLPEEAMLCSWAEMASARCSR